MSQTDPTDAATTSPPKPHLWFQVQLAPIWLYCFSIILATALWLLLDPRAAPAFAEFTGQRHEIAANPMFPVAKGPVYLAARVLWKIGLFGFLVLVLGLFFGSPKQRTLRSWLALTALVALWLGLFASWQEFAWAGQRWRLGRQLAPLQTLVDSLQQNWPSDDARLPGLGDFSAYPIGRPRTLLVNAADPQATGPRITLVDRSADGALRFQIAGDETGAWLEWHPAGDHPASFTDGLEEAHTLDRASPLGDGWHLVRYR